MRINPVCFLIRIWIFFFLLDCFILWDENLRKFIRTISVCSSIFSISWQSVWLLGKIVVAWPSTCYAMFGQNHSNREIPYGLCIRIFAGFATNSNKSQILLHCFLRFWAFLSWLEISLWIASITIFVTVLKR